MKPTHRAAYAAVTAVCALMFTAPAAAVDYQRHPPLTELVERMVREDDYPRPELTAVLAKAVIDPSILDAMQRPYEALPWHRYRKLFLTDRHIDNGVRYWNTHATPLEQAAEQYGVPPEIIVALIGVETRYGANLGNVRVLDALVTLTAEYPRRSDFFARELRAFLNTARAETIAVESVRGSYAGANGIPQFMPTSYQAYAVDFNGNGRRDLSGEDEDAIGSVANYLRRNGWRPGQAIFASLADELPPAAAALVGDSAKPHLNSAQLNDAGVNINLHGASAAMALLRLQSEGSDHHIIGFANLYALTRYNPSVNYAMAVTELSQRIRAQHRP